MKKYDTYKDSGIQWIGQIPAGWKTSKLKYISKFINGFAFASNLFSPDEGCKVIRIGDICQTIDYNSCIRAKIDASVIGQYRIHENDVLVAMSGATTGKSCLVNSIEEAYINQRVGIIRSPSYKFIHYMLNIPSFYQYIMLNNAGSAQPNISSTAIEDYQIPLPPLSEQQAIVQFLDKKTGQIDQSIALLETQKTDLQAYRQALITETVTKGLNPNAPMKDSGIQWIGQIPAGWKTSKLKYISKFINGFAFASNLFSPDEGCKVIRIGDICQTIDYNSCIRAKIDASVIGQYRIHENDVLVAMSGATTGKSCLVNSIEEAYINQRVGIIRSPSYKFIHYMLNIPSFYQYIMLNNAGSAQPNISSTAIEDYQIPLPPLSEQQAIVEYLDKKTGDIDAALKQIDTQIADLRAYRTALISEAVTGKIDVRL